MTMTRRKVLMTGVAAAGALQMPAFAAEPLRFVTLGALDFFLPSLAQDQGMFKKQGVDIDMSTATQAPTLLPAVVGGAIQFGVSTATQVAVANEAGLDVGIVSGAGTISRGEVNTALLVRGDSPLRTPQDFIGKKVMAPGINGTYYMLFLRWLKQGGVDFNKVTIVEGGFAQMPDLLRTQQVDGVLNGEPFLTRMVESGGARRINYFEPEREYYVTSVFIAKRSWVDEHRPEFEKVRAALRETVAFSQKDPAAVNASAAKILKLPPDVMAKQKLIPWKVDVKPEDIQFWADLALEFGLLKAKADAGNLIL